MKLTSSYRNRIKALTNLSAYLCFALILSYIEAVLPLNSFVPVPGFKLGLANIVIILCFYGQSPIGALAVSVVRILLSSLLFGNMSSLMFSLAGGICSYLMLIFIAFILKDKVSFLGVSVLSAASHNIGQFICSLYYIGSSAALSILPALLLSALICGIFTGIILCVIPTKIFLKKEFKNYK